MSDLRFEMNGKTYEVHCRVPAPSSDYQLFENVVDERQRKEMDFAEIYQEQFHHGTTGHNQLMLIAIMAQLLRAVPVMLREVKE